MPHRRTVAVAAIAAIAVAVGASAIYAAVMSPRSPSAACIGDYQHVVEGNDALKGFAVLVDEELPAGAVDRGHVPGQPPQAYSGEFVSGHVRGYISPIAVSGPDRPAMNAAAASLGYPIGSFPLVPLVGPVVQHNPGLLELYVTEATFKSTTGLESWLAMKKASFVDAGYAVSPAPDPRIALSTTGVMGPSDGLHEKILTFDVANGPTALELDFQGGTDLSADHVASVVTAAIDRFANDCTP